ncbi:hypothetical protein EMCRGX_G018677 [Ephydatia muelleri]
MGGSQSVQIPGGGTEGYHVLKVLDSSPAYNAGLEAYFDFIVAIDGVRLNQENDVLKQILQKYMDQPVKLTVYSSKTRLTREVTLVPTSTWGGQGSLGVSIRFCSFEGAAENVWHVLEVHPNSPAAQAGLLPHTDYILGSDAMTGDDDLFSFIENNNNKQLKLFVYNSEQDSCREVLLTPNSEWGGEGSLGCGIGYGYLHRIPARGSQQPPKELPPQVSITPEKGHVSPPPPSYMTTTLIPVAEGFADVPLSVPSQPTTPLSRVDMTSVEERVQSLTLGPPYPPIAQPESLVPAPVTVVRSSKPSETHSKSFATGGVETHSHGTPASSSFQPPSGVRGGGAPEPQLLTYTPGILGASQFTGPQFQPSPLTSRPFVAVTTSGVQQQGIPQLSTSLSGLPTSPPRVSFPSAPPTISLGSQQS